VDFLLSFHAFANKMVAEKARNSGNFEKQMLWVALAQSLPGISDLNQPYRMGSLQCG
jgi:hypothetical protein